MFKQINAHTWIVARFFGFFFFLKKKVTIGKHIQNRNSSNLTGDQYQRVQTVVSALWFLLGV